MTTKVLAYQISLCALYCINIYCRKKVCFPKYILFVISTHWENYNIELATIYKFHILFNISVI